MPEYLAPGVYLEETSFRPKSIEGVSTSTTAFVGPARKGILGLKPDTPGLITPEVITSFGEFERMYGGLGNLSFSAGSDADPQNINYLAHAVKAFFDNGGSRLFVARTFSPRGAGNDGRARSPQVALAGGGALRFTARMPGAIFNANVKLLLKKSRTGKATLLSVPTPGALLQIGDVPAQPARLTGARVTFALNNGDKLVLNVNGTAQTVTFNAAPAEVSGAGVVDPAHVIILANTSLAVTVNDHPGQLLPLTPGDRPLSDIAAEINILLRFGSARVNAGQLVLASDSRGTAARLSVNALPILGLTAAAASGSGNVSDLDRVTIAELDGLLTAAAAGVSARGDAVTGTLILSSATSGLAATLEVTSGPALTSAATMTALGLVAGLKTGTAGAAASFFLFDNGLWKSTSGGPALDPNTADLSAAALLTMSILVRDGESNDTIYDELGFSPLHPRWAGSILSEKPTRKSDAMLNPLFFDIDAAALANPNLPFSLFQALFGVKPVFETNLAGGNDGTEPAANHNPGFSNAVQAAYEDALAVLEKVEDISILAAPGHSALSSAGQAETVQSLLIGHCENVRYRIAVLDTPADQTPGQALDVRSKIDSTRAALYYPWVVVANPSATPGNDRIPKEIALPPSGFVTGLYARTDVLRGVWKAPANETVLGALRFENDITFGQQELLNPQGVNCLRFFYGRGYRVWGARTASSDPEWKYVNVRRYFIYLERSIDRSTQWAVFEPNGEALWANIRETVSAFLFNEWRSGALLGSKPEEAYFVRCDRSTMTQNDLDNGRLICLIGVAAIKPAEFVIFRIGQKTAEARS